MRYAHSLGSMSSVRMDGKLKNPLDYINIVLQIIEHVLSWSGPEKEELTKMPFLLIETNKKSQRAYIIKDNQIVSFAFPFQVYEKFNSGTGLNEWHVRYKDLDVSTSVLSRSRGLYSDYDAYKDKMSFCEIASAQNLSETDTLLAIRLFEVLMLTEPAYVRYDYDPNCANGLKHPLNHFDYNFVEGFHYKIGLHSRINLSQIEDMINKDTDCWYVSKFKESAQEKRKRLNVRIAKPKRHHGRKH